jgi:hypothetical protein
MTGEDHPNPEVRPAFQVGLFVRYLTSVVSVLLLVAAVVWIIWYAKPMQQKAVVAAVTKPVEVRFLWPVAGTPKGSDPSQPPATWLPRQFQEELFQLAKSALERQTDPFSPEPLRNLAQALAASGWYDGMPTIRREGDATVLIDGRWRIPAGVVRADGKYQMISWQGLLMPPQYSDRPKGLLMIEGQADGIPRDADGRVDYAHPWPGEDVLAGLELLALTVQQKWGDQVAGVDVGDYGAKKSLTLLTAAGTRVVWGGRPSKPLIGDASTGQKLANIATLVRDTRRIDGGYPLVYMNAPTPQFDISATAKAAAAKAAQNPPMTVGRK